MKVQRSISLKEESNANYTKNEPFSRYISASLSIDTAFFASEQLA